MIAATCPEAKTELQADDEACVSLWHFVRSWLNWGCNNSEIPIKALSTREPVHRGGDLRQL